MTSAEKESPRAEKKLRLRAEVRDLALKLFFKHGFANVSVEDIVSNSSMSLRSFYRYFPTKEDVVFDWYSHVTELLVTKLMARPQGESPLDSLRETLYSLLEMYDADPKSSYAHLRLTNDNPTLAAKSFEKRLKWQAEFAEILAPRMKGSTAKQKASLITALALSAFYSALDEWQAQDGKTNLRRLMNRSFSTAKKIIK